MRLRGEAVPLTSSRELLTISSSLGLVTTNCEAVVEDGSGRLSDGTGSMVGDRPIEITGVGVGTKVVLRLF